MATTTDELGEIVGQEDEGRPGAPVDPERLWMAVRREWRWIPIAGAIWLVLGLTTALFFMAHSYRAEAVLVYQPNGNSRGDLRGSWGSVTLPGALRKVKDRLKLKMAIKFLQKQVDVWFDGGSLVTVIGLGPSAWEAKVLANTLVDVFLEGQHDVLRNQAEEAGKALAKDLAGADAQLRQKQAEFDQFRSTNGVTDIEHETKLAIENAAHLKEQLQQARGDISSCRPAPRGSVPRRKSSSARSCRARAASTRTSRS